MQSLIIIYIILILPGFHDYHKMINIGILLDVFGIAYSETQLLKLETLVNNLITKLLEKNSSDPDPLNTSGDPIKEDFFAENILEIKDGLFIEPEENTLEIKDDIPYEPKENTLEIRDDITNEPIEGDFRKNSEVEPVFIEEQNDSKDDQNLKYDCESNTCRKLYGPDLRQLWCTQCTLPSKLRKKQRTQPKVKQNEKIKEESNGMIDQDKNEIYHCSKCNQNFDEKEAIFQHMASTHRNDQKKIPCPECKTTFIKVTKLRTHYKEVHEGKKTHKCPYCDNCFSRQGKLRVHIKKIHKGDKAVKCKICDVEFSEKNEWKEHVAAVHEGVNPYQCYICGKMYASKHILLNHIQGVHEGFSVKCQECDKVFTTQKALKGHVNSVHLKNYFFCEICGKSFNYKSILKNHIETTHEVSENQCDLCGKFYATERHLKLHKKEFHNKVIKCDNCDKLFGSRTKLNFHVQIVHKSKDHQCPHCDYEGTPFNLSCHVKKMHGEQISCDKCEKIFYNEKSFQNHVKNSHNLERHFKCDKCNDSFFLLDHFKRHVRQVHDKSKPFECTICFKRFNFKKTLDQHFAREHEPKSCKSCPYCGKYKSQLKSHIEICNSRWPDGKRPTFECPNNCGKILRNKDSLRAHLKKSCTINTKI